MTLRALVDPVVRGPELRIALPWIRSLPLASVRDLVISVDGRPVDARLRIDDRAIAPADLAGETGWWYLQDRLVAELATPDANAARIGVSFVLEVPYLAAGPDGPLRLPQRDEREIS